MTGKTENTAGSSHAGASRTLAVLEAVANNSPESSSVTGLAESLGMPKAVVHRLLQELVASEFLSYEAESRRYGLGLRTLMVGMAALRGLDVPHLARPFLVRLVEATGETATLSMRQGWHRIYVDQVASPREIRMTVGLGTSHPLHAGSSSKAILATLNDEEVERCLDVTALSALTARTITDVASLKDELTKVRDAGYAISLGEREAGAASVAAPVRVATDASAWGSISVCGPRDRFSESDYVRYAELVRDAAGQLSQQCGHGLTAAAEVTS